MGGADLGMDIRMQGLLEGMMESEDDRALRLIQEQKQSEFRNFGKAFRKECEDAKEIPE